MGKGGGGGGEKEIRKMDHKQKNDNTEAQEDQEEK